MSEKLVSSTQGSHDSTHEGDAQVIPVFDIQEELKKLPDRPGVYIMHDAKDAIIYVGKAINLKRRVHQYFVRKIGRGPKIERMVEQIARFEYIVTDSELEALVLENNLIKEHRPKYNTLLKDDKTYPYIRVTVEEEYPRVQFTRKMKKDKSRYFGPFKSAWAVRDTIDLLRKLYKIRDCSRVLPRDIGQERPCLNYQIGQCDAPCQGQIGKEAYRENVDRALDFLNGNYAPVLKMLEEKMQKASEELNFEDAASYRDLRESVLQVSQKQKIDQSDGEDKDILAMAQDGQDAVVQVFFVRGGRLIGRDHYFIRIGMDEEPQEILSNFVKQFYAGTPFLPRELMLEEGRTIGAMQELASLLGIGYVSRLEAYDISNTSGVESVGSMVVFEHGKPRKSDYRKFKIRTVQGPNDYASLKEVLTRRFEHGLREKEELERKHADSRLGSFTNFPDLIMMDGGRGQVNIAEEVMEELQLEIPVCGMVKDDYHRTRGLYFRNVELPIDTRSEGFKLITRVQDEAHRFAIEYHRSLRSRAQTHSMLEEIEGIGPARRKALLRAFGSLEGIRDADLEALSRAPSMNRGSAEKVYAFFHPEEKKPADEAARED